ncbi:glycoside hydrolase 5 family protein [Flammeovirga pacifica]|uniref:Glycoside hydrolase family 5 domain-containing protein n=1 Tax=Flammeovirga pacifica TaxID=915059 RepID=A0A1S1Z669_FLAPC|nr:hypothetical protein [Flammeovirga pacifica]OHX68545.1 hypothetical protein NH26_11855 [Flammeovirga pacifica]
MNKKKISTFFIFFLIITSLFAQKNQDVYVDKEGVMRWPNKEEIKGFGVNYTGPFAHAYRSAKKMNIDLKDAIDEDIYHFARLGFDGYRVHVWDTEISDSLGNLLINEHLDLFDYMIAELKKRGVKCLITPIAFWGNGWPEKDTYSPGFSHKYGKSNCLTNPDAIQAQVNYLYQFLNHKNKYTGIAYKDEPNIIAFEISNEPHHSGTPKQVTAYIKKMLKSMKSTGCQKPIFYNVSHSIQLVDAYYKAGIDGGTFQWYPTNLVSGEELKGNFLVNVDDYKIPFSDHKIFQKKAKVVYEFDCADIMKSYMYPAMSRSFRKAGIQWATQFAYDPTFLADKNTEYNTHYMNLAYTPNKAISLKISSEIFHEVPLYADYGRFPDNTTFKSTSINYENDVVIFDNESKYFYTNSHQSQPKEVTKLKEIAGVGTSTLVNYEGTGAYFLDQLEDGVWRLEVMPDVVITKNPLGKNSLNKQLADILWNTWKMKINLPQLGNDFSIKGVNKDNRLLGQTSTGSFDIQPGAYILTKNGIDHHWTSASKYHNITIGEFKAPNQSIEKPLVIHKAIHQISEHQDVDVTAQFTDEQLPQELQLIGYNDGKVIKCQLHHVNAYTYKGKIKADQLNVGYLNYTIIANTSQGMITYPEGVKGQPSDWDFTSSEKYSTRIVKENTPIVLFDPKSDFVSLNKTWNKGVKLSPSIFTSRDVLQINLAEVPIDEAMNEPTYGIRHFIGDKLPSTLVLNKDQKIRIKARSLNEVPQKMELSFVDVDGKAYGKTLAIDHETEDYLIDIKDLKPTKVIILPRGYPSFLPYYLEPSEIQEEIDWSKIETLQIKTLESHCQIEIESIQLTNKLVMSSQVN